MIRYGCIVATAIALLIMVSTSAIVGVGAIAPSGWDPAASWVKPVSGAVISQGFGCTSVSVEPFDAACPTKRFHSGVDLAVSTGTPVHAAATGVVRVIASPVGFGLHVIIDHGAGLQSLYGHLSEVLVANGDSVSAGDVIGQVGSTGNSTGPHLHFEIDRDGISEDPLLDIALP